MSDVLIEVNGVAITDGARQASPLLRDTIGTFTFVCHRAHTSVLLPYRGNGTPTEESPDSSPRSNASTPHKDGAWLEPTKLVVRRGDKLGVTVSQHDDSRRSSCQQRSASCSRANLTPRARPGYDPDTLTPLIPHVARGRPLSPLYTAPLLGFFVSSSRLSGSLPRNHPQTSRLPHTYHCSPALGLAPVSRSPTSTPTAAALRPA